MSEQIYDINDEHDVLVARRASRDLAKRMGFGLADQTRLATAVSELTRNVLQYAGSGTCTLEDDGVGRSTIRVIVEDQGPGIDDLELAMTDGFTSRGGLGMGLPGARRLAHRFHIESEPGRTRIVLELDARR